MTKKTCAECTEYIEKNGKCLCHECFDVPIEEVTDCPLGVTEEEITEIENKKIKVETGAKGEKKERKKRPPREPDADKVFITAKVFELLEPLGLEGLVITNKTGEIDFTYGEKKDAYTLKLVKHRPPKQTKK